MTSLVAVLAIAGSAWGQEYPTKPVRILTSDAGGSNDILARVISQGIAGSLGQPVLVENRSGISAQETVGNSAPDGHTLICFGSGLWLLPQMKAKLSYDMTKYTPVTWSTTGPLVLVVHPSLPARSVSELVKIARARPGELNYAAGAPGTIQHLASEMLKSMAKVNIVYVPYKGPGATIIDTLAGHVHMNFAPPSIATPHIKSGKLIALAVTSGKPSPLLPGLPTVAQAGSLPGFDAVTVSGVLAPAKTPAAIINRLHREIARVLGAKEVKDKFAGVGVEVVGAAPDVFAAKIAEQVATLGKIIREANIRAD